MLASGKAKIQPFNAPPWIADPKLDNCGLKVKKDGKLIKTITDIAKRKYVLFGRNASMSDIKLDHPSISRRHALVGHGSSGNIYIMDLGSSHGSFVNKLKLEKRRRQPLQHNDVITFGASTREYIIKLDLDIDNDDSEIQKTTNNENNNDSNKRKRDNDNNNENVDERPKKKQKKMEIDGNKDENTVHCYHLLVKHKESRNPKSWKSDKIERTKEEALEMIKKFREEISKNEKMLEKFKEIAKKESDCSSAKRGGDLGKFGKGRMQKPFEEAAFNLSIGELSQPVNSKSGVHIIFRVQ